MNVNKRKKQGQQQVEADITPLLLGKIHYGKLKSVHFNLVCQEIEARTQKVPDESLGIQALTKILRTDEKTQLVKI